MTFRKPQSQSKFSSSLWGLRDRLRKKRRQDRRSLLESLETRHLMAGPQLIGIQPNEGQLLFEPNLNATGVTVLNVAPNELVFRFDDDTTLDEATLSAIRITRAGDDNAFESASATTDLGTSGQVLLEFRAKQSGTIGNGIQVVFTTSDRNDPSARITVSGRTVNIDVNRANRSVNPTSQNPTRVADLLSAVANNAAANSLIEVIQVSGASQAVIGTTVTSGTTLTLQGANAAEALTDFGTGGQVRVRLTSQLPGADGRGIQLTFEQRNFGGVANPVVVVTDKTIRVQLNSSPGNESTVTDFLTAIQNNPDASSLISAAVEVGSANTVIGNELPSNYSPLTLSGVGDIVVEPGFIGLGDSPREVVFRFAQPLPDDTYQIDILGSGPLALSNVNGELFQDGVSFTRQFNLNLGPQVVAVVPEPIRRNANGSISPDVGKIEVHFNDDDLDPTLAQNPDFYQLIMTNDTATNLDDFTRLNTPGLRPTSVTYNSITNVATLDFGRPLSRIPNPNAPGQFLTGSARLRVGTTENLPAPPTLVNLNANPSNPIEPGDSFSTAFDLNTQWNIGASATQSARLSSEIFNPTPFGLDLPGPDLAGTRNIRPDDPSRLTRTVPLDYVRGGADVIDGISVIQYNFASSWLGDDPSRPGVIADTTYFNVISQQQRQRVREVLQLYSEYLGVQFVEVEGEFTSDAFFSIAVGDLYGTVEAGETAVNSGPFNPNNPNDPNNIAVALRDRDGDGVQDLGVLDFQDFDESIDDQFGGEFFRGAMFVVGQLLGYGYADDLTQPVTQSTAFIFTPGTESEPSYPSAADIVNGQYLFRPDSIDVDLYKFTLDSSGRLAIETIAERLGAPSLLDTTLRLYRLNADGSSTELAINDDYFSNDSLIDVQVEAGTYVVGVSAKGNTSYDPSISGTGFGGRSEGEYELRLDFRPSVGNVLRDTTGVALDGDGDGRPGGVFDFWFVPADANNTLYVDKAASAVSSGQIGTVANPYREIDLAIAAARPGDTIRVVGNGGADNRIETLVDNLAYNIGFANNGLPLEDGSTIDLPQGVRMVIDSGAILKFSRARLGVGSTSPLVDHSDSALQVLGTPTIITSTGLPARDATNALIPGSVIFTSVNDRTVGIGNAPAFTPTPQPGDWGGIDFRGDLDTADELRRNREDEGVFLNHIQFADMRYGGGAVSIGGRQVPISPIDMAVTRPTIINSQISLSADAAMSASPDTFAETRFTEANFQAGGAFTPDYDRVGPEIHGNTVIDNSLNGLFIRVLTRTGNQLETIGTTARFDDTDIPHILTENLVIDGTPGGPIIQSSAPSSLLVRSAVTTAGSVPVGTYVYRITNVDGSGIESASSQATLPVTLTTVGGVQLSQLPTPASGSGFVSRRLYRATVDTNGLPGQFLLVAQLNASSTSFVDRLAVGTTPLSSTGASLRSRLDSSLTIDPGTVLKIDGARIEARFGANLLAEGSPSNPIIFTSLEDQRYGGGGTFDTNNVGVEAAPAPEDLRGDWGGIYIGVGSAASLDNVVVAGGGGTTRIEGGFASFNAVELHQGTLRIANSRLEFNADGRGATNDTRVGRGDNASGTVFVRASTPVVIDNNFIGGVGPALSFDVNSLSSVEVTDPGRSTGLIDRTDVFGNSGPFILGNSLTNNGINGLQVRGGQLATAGVWDDVDIVHVVTESIEIPNQFVYGGLRLRSDGRGSLVVKFENAPGETAGIVVGGSLLGAGDQFRDIADRIGGSLQIIGHPDFPVVLTTLADDFAGAGFTLDGRPQLDTNNDGIVGGDLAGSQGPLFPIGPEVNNGTLIDNDVDPLIAGSFSFSPGPGGVLQQATTTVQGLTQLFTNQTSLFDYGFFIDVGADGAAVGLDTTTILQQPTLVSDDRVVSTGSFAGANGTINWVMTQSFQDGRPDLVSEVTFSSDQPLGNLRFINYYDPIIGTDSGDILFTEGTPGADDFRITVLDGPEEIGFRQYGAFTGGPGLNGASYEGWIADDFPQLITPPVFNLPFVPNGTIAAGVPLLNDARFPNPNYGPGILTSALAWLIDPTATSATITTNLEVIAETFGTVPNSVTGGNWNGVTIREGADDRNVAAFTEQEPTRTSVVDTNSIPTQSEFLGELAPNQQSGDENRRLGFIVDGVIATNDDIDVYSFIGESGTEVWLDIDRTSNRLDSIVELIDVNGRVLAASNDSLAGESSSLGLYPNANFPAVAGVDVDIAQPLSVVAERLQGQRITINETIVDSTGGVLTLSIAGSLDTITIGVDTFLADPALAIETALETQFGAELGPVTATLQRRDARVTDPNNSAVVLRAGDDFVIELRFDADFFVGRQAPLVRVDSTGVLGITIPNPTVAAITFTSQLQDAYSSNAKDAGMRIVLPGEAGTRNIYHVRVRSSNTTNSTNFGAIVDASRVRDGLTSGRYELQIRLQEADESPGTQVRLSDIRYAVNGIQVIGQPLHSPLLGEDYETAAPNDSLATAQPLGFFGVANDANAIAVGPLQSDQLAKSFAGSLNSLTDVDWYRFTISYDNITRDNAALYLSTVFDLDYADNFARADMALYVFNEAGQLVLVGGDSNVADDQSGQAGSNDSTDLSRGSAGTQDPYIGAAELREGTYFVAVANQQQVPLPLDQFFNAGSLNPLLRLEPIDSVRRIAEDRIGSSGGGTASDPTIPLLFDDNSIIPYSFDDQLLYVNTGSSLFIVNPFTGENYGSVGTFSNGEEIEEIAFRSNGELFSYSGFGNRQRSDNNWFYYQIDTGTAALSAPLSTGANINTFSAVFDAVNNVFTVGVGNTGLDVEATTIAAFDGIERGFFVANRPFDLINSNAGSQYTTNILYQFVPQSGIANGPQNVFLTRLNGAGTSVQEVGQIFTGTQQTLSTQLGIKAPTVTNAAGQRVAGLSDEDSFTLTDNNNNSVTFEFNSGLTLTADGLNPILDGQTVTIDNTVFEFNTGERLQLSPAQPVGTLTEGSTVRVVGLDGQVQTFEFVRTGTARLGNVAIQTLNNVGQPLTGDQVAASLAANINLLMTGINARSVLDQVVFTGPVTPQLTVTGAGISTLGDNQITTPGAVGVNVSETISAELLVSRLAAAIRSQGISVVSDGNQLALPSSQTVVVNPAVGGGLSVTGQAGLANPGSIEILIFPGDTEAVVAARMAAAIEANGGGTLSANVEPSGKSLSIVGGFISNVFSPNNSLVAGGIPSGGAVGGTVTGAELVTENGVTSLYAITNTGDLFRVSAGELRTVRDGSVGTYVRTATDLIGLNFTSLRSGPVSYNDGELRETLFGMTANGDIYAFNTAGELQPIFAGGRSMISTGIGGARGLDFSTLSYNLFHVTGQRGADPGHGINATGTGSRGVAADGSTTTVLGGSSLAFTYEANAFFGNYPSSAEQPVNFTGNGVVSNPRVDGTLVEDHYNFPGGAKGVVQSNAFSLEGFAAADEPVLYFNYFLEADGTELDSGGNIAGRDALRVYVVTQDGAQHLVSSNKTARGGGAFDDEFDDPTPVGQYNDNIDVDVQQLFTSTNTWRQARVPLGEFAGMPGLSLRVEFSTAGTTQTGSASLRTKAGDQLVEGQSFVIGGETFSIDFAPTVSLPTGAQLANLYSDPNATATITVDGQQYVLDDGRRVIGNGQISIPLLGGLPAGTSLAALSASEIAAIVTDAIRISPPTNPVVSGLLFSDAQDADPNAGGGRNDRTFEAIALPYSGGNMTFVGVGQLGNDRNFGDLDDPRILALDVVNTNDVDMLRVEVVAGTVLKVDLSTVGSIPIQGTIRFFDEFGIEIPASVLDTNSATLQVPSSGTVFIGISGQPNTAYDPRFGTNQSPGQIGKYQASVAVNLPLSIQADSNAIELGGLANVQASPSSLFSISGQSNVLGIPVPVSRFMSANEVAGALRQVVADRFTNGNVSVLPIDGASLRLPLLTIDDVGPFVDESERWGDQFASGVRGGAIANDFEGVYLDDFIIGFAERGEIATGSNVVDTPFVQDLRPQFPSPADPTSSLNTGSYQVEIRDASEYLNSQTASAFRTFDTNDRLADSRSVVVRGADQIRDGQTFEITDGRATVVFEFDLTESGTGVTPGNVAVPFTLSALVPGSQRINATTGLPIAGTGVVRPQTAAEVAASVVAAVNRSDVASVLAVSALLASGVDSDTDARINLAGDIVVVDDSGAFESIDRSTRRGDTNRDRDGQGVILIENTRFLFNTNYGVDISHDVTANVAGVDTNSILRYPRNLVELNSESIIPGVVVQSNIFAYNGNGGIQIAGLQAAGETQSDPIPFERIVNNTIVGGSITAGFTAPSETFQGVFFPGGAISFADAVVSYTPNATGRPPASIFQNATTALGAPDRLGRGSEPVDGQFTVSLGLGGSLVVEFTDNLLTGSGDSRPDLIVFETGDVESVQVQVSRDGITFFTVGILGGLTNQIDLDAAGFGPQDRFAFVRLTDLRQGSTTSSSLGADIDAIGALTTVPVDRYTAGGNGINVVGQAAPALLNNVVANSDVGIVLPVGSTLPIVGGNAFYRNTLDVPAGASIGQFAQQLTSSESVFIAPAELVFSPSAGSRIIDSSIDSVEDRSSLTAVKNPLGLPTSPILAPRLDVNGQLRIDDPNVETPSGLGERVFKDRGASDRGDLFGPRAVLLSPTAPDLGLSAGVVSVFGEAPRAFEIQLLDGLAPADVTPGTGIDDRTVTSGSVLLFKDNVPLVEGIDYRFGYNPSTNVIRLTPIAGVFAREATYVIRLIDSSDAVISASDGSGYFDGTRLSVIDSSGVTTTFEYETGITIALSTILQTVGAADGLTLEVFDGVNTVIYELDDNGITGVDSIPVDVSGLPTVEEIGASIAAAINATGGLTLTAVTNGSNIQLLGANPLASVTSSSTLAAVSGAVGTAIGFGLQIPADGARPADTIVDGQVFVVRRGARTAFTFEFDNDNVISTTGAIPIRFSAVSTLDDIANEIVRAVGGTGLGLSPSNVGFGRVFLGGDANYSVDVTASVLTQVGIAGEVATVPITIQIDQSRASVAASIQSVIESLSLAGVTTSLINDRIFVEGTNGISGVGAVGSAVVADLVGNRLQSNQSNGKTELTIFIGNGFDFGDAPAPYQSLASGLRPRHAIDPTFTLGATVTPDADALVPNADEDDGIGIPVSMRAGFQSQLTINVNSVAGRAFYVDAWFDWNGNKLFDANEVIRYGSAGTGRIPLSTGVNIVPVTVPADAATGEIYARFRLSEPVFDANGLAVLLGPTGDAASGEVEDYSLFITNNPFTNPVRPGDVNNSGASTPLDALQIINVLNRYQSVDPNARTINLSDPLPPGFVLPVFPDVNGDGQISAADALAVIQILNQADANGASGEGELLTTGFVRTASGVLASQATLIGDALINGSSGADGLLREEVSLPSESAPKKAIDQSSVFDPRAIIELDSIVDLIAEDNASARLGADSSDSELNPFDAIFSQM